MNTYEILITENKKISIEAEDLHYENETKNGIRMVYLTVTNDDWWNPVAMFNLANIIGIRKVELATNKEDK